MKKVMCIQQYSVWETFFFNFLILVQMHFNPRAA